MIFDFKRHLKLTSPVVLELRNTEQHLTHEAQQSQRDRATRYVSCNVVNCCMHNNLRKITFKKACNR